MEYRTNSADVMLPLLSQNKEDVNSFALQEQLMLAIIFAKNAKYINARHARVQINFLVHNAWVLLLLVLMECSVYAQLAKDLLKLVVLLVQIVDALFAQLAVQDHVIHVNYHSY